MFAKTATESTFPSKKYSLSHSTINLLNNIKLLYGEMNLNNLWSSAFHLSSH